MSDATKGGRAPASMMDRAAARWLTLKPIALGVIGGLVVGPIISGMIGFQTRTSTAQAAMRASVVEQQAGFCFERARATLPADAPRLAWNNAYDLALRWSAMPGAVAGAPVDPDVRQDCARKLSN